MSTAASSIAGRIGLLAALAVVAAGCLPGPAATPASLVAPSPATVAAVASMESSTSGLPVSPVPPPTPAATVAPTPAPTPTPTPAPVRGPVNVSLLARPASFFITEIRKTWCAAAATQMVLAIDGKVELTAAVQKKIVARSAAFWTWRDSHNKGWGPAMIAAVLDDYGVPGYTVKTYKTRAAALLDAAKAIQRFRQPVVLMAWYGAHAWVMTGFRATADPLVFPDATVSGAYILDAWYPRVSTLWGRSDPPGTFQDAAEMRRNYLPWKRPEGRYPARDGLFVAVVPTRPAP